MSISKHYVQEVRDNTNYLATWLPTVTVAVGDVGTIRDYEYQPLTNLKALGIDFESAPAHVVADVNYYSAGSVSISTKLAGDAPLAGSALAQAKAGMSIRFSRDNGVVLLAARCQSRQIKQMLEVSNEILKRHTTGEWKPDWVLVTEVVSADSTTILISRGSSAAIDLAATGSVSAPTLNLADVDAKFEIVQQSNIGTNILATRGLTPLFRAAAIRKHLFRPDQFRDAGPERSGEELKVGDVDYDDFATG